MYYTDEIMTDIISSIRREFPDCAITLSVGRNPMKHMKDIFRQVLTDTS